MSIKEPSRSSTVMGLTPPFVITHSIPLGRVLIRALVELLDCLDDLASYCTVLCAYPLDMGILYVFCALFRLPNVGQGYNAHFLFVMDHSLCALCLATCVSLGRACTFLPIVSDTAHCGISRCIGHPWDTSAILHVRDWLAQFMLLKIEARDNNNNNKTDIANR